jgi:DNA-binding protein YbaB
MCDNHTPSADEHVGTTADGTVVVTVASDGTLLRALVKDGWKTKVAGAGLGRALVEAFLVALSESRAGRGTDADRESPEPPAPRPMFGAMRRFRQDQGGAAARRVASRLVEETRKMVTAIKETDEAAMPGSEAVEHVGKDQGSVVTVRLNRMGSLVAVELDKTWIDARSTDTITERVNEAITAAKAAMPPAARDPLVGTLFGSGVSSDPDDLIYRLAQ